MEKRFDYELEKDMDNTFMFLCQTFSASGHNKNPVISHSIRVGLMLFHYGYSREIVLAGILHDILEDTDLRYEELEAKFGKEIAQLVLAATFNPEIRSNPNSVPNYTIQIKQEKF